MIEEYKTGLHMKIKGKVHQNDLKIVTGQVKGDWWRNRGHRLEPSDIKDILEAEPEVLVVGTGYAGNMQVPEATRSAVAERGIELMVDRTEEAVSNFNRLYLQGRDIAGAFHLTC